MKHFSMLLQTESSTELNHYHGNIFIFHYDFLGSNSYVEVQMMPSDCYTINEKISLTFKSSLQSLRMYFQRIFYVPINIYYQGAIIANYHFDFSKFLPNDNYFNSEQLWMKTDTFCFDQTNKIVSPMVNKPSIDFIFSIQLLNLNEKKYNYYNAVPSVKELPLVSIKNQQELPQNLNELQSTQACRKKSDENNVFTSSDFKEYLEFRRKYQNAIPHIDFTKERMEGLPIDTKEHCIGLSKKSELLAGNKKKNVEISPQINSVSEKVGGCSAITDTPIMVTIGVNTEYIFKEDEFKQDELCLKAVQELEEWKQQQMQCFLEQLARKGEIYVKELKETWELRRLELEARLEAKLAKCERLNEELEKTNTELSSEKSRDRLRLAENIKKDFHEAYIRKFMDLNAEVQCLKADMQKHEKALEIKSAQIQVENERLYQEKMALKEHIEQLERKFSALEDTQLPAEQLKNALNDLVRKSHQIILSEIMFKNKLLMAK